MNKRGSYRDPMLATQGIVRVTAQRGIQSIEIGGRILLALAESSKPVGLKELALATEMPSAKIHPYLVSFIKLDFVEQNMATGLYGLGRQSLQLGLSYLQKVDAISIAREEILRLASETDQSVALSVWGNMGPTILQFEQSPIPVLVYLRVGTVMSLVNTATGLAFSAYMPAKLIEGMLKSEPLRFGGSEETAKMPWDRVEEALIDVRRRGLSRAVSLTVQGLNAFGAPVFNHSSQVTMAVTITGPDSHFDADWDSPIAKLARDCANTISARIGYRE